MKVDITWDGAMRFTSTADGKETFMDAKAPIGTGTSMTPKEIVAAGLGGCTAMDVAALFKKHKQTPESFEITVDVESSTGVYPAVFTRALITFNVCGPVSKDIFIEAVTLSQTKYCGVSAMLVKAFPIHYKAILNSETILEGQAHFGG